jgi:hypothetical protein
VLFREALNTAIRANATVNDLVAGNVRPVNVPRTDTGPSLTYRVRRNKRGQNLDGPDGTARATVLFTLRASAEADVDALKEALRNLFDGSTAAMGSVEVMSVESDDEDDDYQQGPDGSDGGIYEQEFVLVYRYREPLPTHS